MLGLIGYWFAHKLGMPKVFREGAGWRDWFAWPMLFGLGLGAILVIVDRFFSGALSWSGFPHPQFPLSLTASAAAGIGEEILFRSFVMGLWAFLINLILRR